MVTFSHSLMRVVYLSITATYRLYADGRVRLMWLQVVPATWAVQMSQTPGNGNAHYSDAVCAIFPAILWLWLAVPLTDRRHEA